MFSVCVLCYGDHADLAHRCLGSIIGTADWKLVNDVRVGLNAVGAATSKVLDSLLQRCPVPCWVFQPADGANVGKYPLMRRMLYPDLYQPVSGPHTDKAAHKTAPVAERIMWFDDDSCVRGDRSWWQRVAALKEDFIGARYQLRGPFRAGQVEAIKAQPWYAGKPIPRHYRPSFLQGGWWIAKAALLRKHDYPFPVLHHNGGDSLLGELIRQQDYSSRHWNTGVWINADHQGRESAAKRRGMTTRWPWEGWRPDAPMTLVHHNFSVQVTRASAVAS